MIDGGRMEDGCNTRRRKGNKERRSESREESREEEKTIFRPIPEHLEG